ncbi:MAG: ATP-binding protein [Muribaculaceae bacterium]|nr:ATP-binding protein [Muribaculaceae bacterium]MBR0023881.1 ATP-binding protein [Muribaculaceae bacterium]
MINRKINKYLVDFFKKSKNALLLTGARQVGKTFSIRQFGLSHYECFLELNFADNLSAAKAIASATNANDVLIRLSLLSAKPLVAGKTLIFFDEVQECPEIITAIKFLVEDGRYRYILSGSLLGVDLGNIRSLPVGYMTTKEMFPLDFEEFIEALGVSDNIIKSLKISWNEKIPVDDFVHNRMMQIFRLYLIVGGMPQAVQTYLDSNNLQQVIEVQESIVEMYKKDISKYDSSRKLDIEELYELIAPELNAKNKRFVLKSLNKNAKFSRLENSFLWLKDAGVALPVYNVEEPKSPLVLSRSRNLFKLFLSDVGLLAKQYADGIQLNIINGNDNINYGAIFENFVAQELHAHGFPLFYFNSKKQGEIDFLIEKDGMVVPIEVKSGKDYERHRALRNVLSNPDYNIDKGIVLCNANVSNDNNISYMPIYMIMFMQHDNNLPLKFTINLDGLQ